jgi:hypothetical protein
VVTKQDAVTALDEDLRDGKPPSPAVRSCRRRARPVASTRDEDSIRADPRLARLARGSRRLKRTFQTNCEKRETAGLTGLGDGACWYSAGRDEVQLLKGVTLVDIIVRKNGDATEALKKPEPRRPWRRCRSTASAWTMRPCYNPVRIINLTSRLTTAVMLSDMSLLPVRVVFIGRIRASG